MSTCVRGALALWLPHHCPSGASGDIAAQRTVFESFRAEVEARILDTPSSASEQGFRCLPELEAIGKAGRDRLIQHVDERCPAGIGESLLTTDDLSDALPRS